MQQYDPDKDRLAFRAQSKAAPQSSSLTWQQIALGVFVALMAHTIIVSAWTHYQLKRELEKLETEIDAQIREAQNERIEGNASVSPVRGVRYDSAPVSVPLQVGEKCVSGIRVRQINGSWKQTGIC